MSVRRETVSALSPFEKLIEIDDSVDVFLGIGTEGIGDHTAIEIRRMNAILERRSPASLLPLVDHSALPSRLRVSLDHSDSCLGDCSRSATTFSRSESSCLSPSFSARKVAFSMRNRVIS